MTQFGEMNASAILQVVASNLYVLADLSVVTKVTIIFRKIRSGRRRVVQRTSSHGKIQQ